MATAFRREVRGAEGDEWGWVWEGYPLPSRLGGLGKRHELPSGARDGASAENILLEYVMFIKLDIQ